MGDDARQHRQRLRNTNDADELIAPSRLLKWGLLCSLLTALLPLHVWGAYNFSFRTLLYGYIFAIVGAFYGIAAIVLLLGVLVPPIMLGHWIYEVHNEPMPVEPGPEPEPDNGWEDPAEPFDPPQADQEERVLNEEQF